MIKIGGITYGQGNVPLKEGLIILLGLEETKGVYNDYKRNKIKAPSELVPTDAKGAYIRNIRLRTPHVDHLFEPTEFNYYQIFEHSNKIIEEIKKEVKRILHAVFYADIRFNFQYSKHHFEMTIEGEDEKLSDLELRFDFWLSFFENFVLKSEYNSKAKELSNYQRFLSIDSFEPDKVDKFCFNTFFDFFEQFIFRYSDGPINWVFQPVYNHIKNKPYLYHKEKRPIPTSLRDLWSFPADFVFHYGEDCIKLARKKLRYPDFKHKDERRYSDVARLIYLFDLEKALTIRSYNKLVNRQILRGRFDIFFSSNAVDTSYILQNVTYRELKQILGHYDISSSLKDTLGSSDLLLLSHPLFRLRRGTTHQCDTDTFLEVLKVTSREKISSKILALLDK